MKYKYFDREEFVRQAADNEGVAREVAQLYHRDIANDLSLMEEHFSNLDIDAVRRLAHKSKSGFIIMGAKDLYELAVNIEARSKKGETDLGEDLTMFREMCLGLDREVVEAFAL